MSVEITDWAKDILHKSQTAAVRFNPDAKIRLTETGGGVEAQLAAEPAPDDRPVELEDMTLYVEAGLEGMVDVQEPHDQLVLRPAGSTPNTPMH